MLRRRKLSAITVILAAVALLLMSYAVKVVVDESIATEFTAVFYNDTAPDAKRNNNSGDVLDASFQSNILDAAPEEVRANPEGNVEWFVDDLYDRIYDADENSGDPVLLAQLAADASIRAPQTTGEKLVPIAQQSPSEWSEIVLSYIEDYQTHIQTAGKLQAVWNRAETVIVRPINGGYTSMGYQTRDGLDLEADLAEKLGRESIPLPVLDDSQGNDGYEIVFTYQNGEVLSYRINCGYQPDATSYPDFPGTPTTPTPTTPTPTTPTPTTPTLEPKDPDGGPQGQFPNNPDFGGGSNVDIDKTPTDEPEQPTTYTPPSAPVTKPDTVTTPADEGQSIVDKYQPDSNGNRQEETIRVDTDGDGHEDQNFTGEVVVGDPPDTPLSDVHKDPPRVESGLNDGANNSVVGPPN